MIVSGLFSAAGLFGSVWYIRRSLRRRAMLSRDRERQANASLFVDRPGRRLGAAIVGFVSVMFFCGVNFLDVKAAPLTYMVFWCVMAVMLLWLCGLALADMLHTRRLLRQMYGAHDETRPREGGGQ